MRKMVKVFEVYGIMGDKRSFIGTFGGYEEKQAIRECQHTINLQNSAFRKRSPRKEFDRF